MTFWYPKGVRFEDLNANRQRQISQEWGRQIAQSAWFHEGMNIIHALETAPIDPIWVLPPDVIYPTAPPGPGSTLLGHPVVFTAGATPHLRIDLPHTTPAPLGPFDPKDATP